MNPAKFLFNAIRGVHFETLLLEACDWSEERADFVKEHLESYFQSVLLDTKVKNTRNLMESIEKDLLSHLDRKEVDACLHIINQLIDSASEIREVASYEN